MFKDSSKSLQLVKGQSSNCLFLCKWPIVGKDPKLQHIFPAPPLIAFKRVNNLQGKLVKAKLPPDEDLKILIELANE